MNDSYEEDMIPVRCWLSPYGFVLHQDDLKAAKAVLSGRAFVRPHEDPAAYEQKRIAALGQLGSSTGKKKSGARRKAQKPEGVLRDSVSKCLAKWHKV
jgi:hypothetical protein